MDKRIVVVGAGYAGILTTKKLAKNFKKNDRIEITIIDKNPYHTMLTELHEVAACRVDEESIRINLEKVFAKRRVNVVLDTVDEIDFEGKKVIGKNNSYDYDYVVIGSGSKPTFWGVEGAEENAYTLWSYDDAVLLKDRIHNLFIQASKEPDRKKRRQLLTFHVVGAGFTGVELIGEIAEYVPILCKQYSIDRNDVNLANLDGLSRAVPILPEKLSEKVRKRLNKMGVRTIFNAMVQKVGADSIEFKVGEKIIKEDSNTIIWVAGVESEDLSIKAGKALGTSQRAGRIETDAYLRAKNHDNVFVVGDNIYYVLPDDESQRPVPQMVENAEHSASLVANNITALIQKGKKQLKEYKPSFHGVMVCIGGRYGVARVGAGKMMFNLPSFFAMFSKHLINCVYFIQVLGWNKVFNYAKHEFFTIRHNRSFVGGHFSNKNSTFFILPIRLWLGAIWVYEAILKMAEGWMDTYKLDKFFEGANNFYAGFLGSDTVAGASGAVTEAVTSASGAVTEAVTSASGAVTEAVTSASGAVTEAVTAASGAVTDVVTAATGAVSDAVTAASGAVASAGALLINWNFLNIFQVIFATTNNVFSHAGLSDYAFKINVPLMNWFVNKVILSNDSVAFVLQASIVIVELLIGLAILGGLFTTLSGFVSIGLQLMFLTTTGWYVSNMWMFFASFAILFGAGYSFGLDYYVMPFVKKTWKRIPFVKKWYLYND